MNRYKLHMGVPILFTLLVSSCEKWGNGPLSGQLAMGDLDHVEVSYHDSVFQGDYNHPPAVFYLDADRDGEDDFAISSRLWGSPAIGMIPDASIACLNNTSFLNVTSFMDTMFLHTDTLVYTSNQVEVMYRIYHTCERRGPYDSVMRVTPANELKSLKRNETISISDNWISDTIDLTGSYYSTPPSTLSYSEDSLVLSQDVYIHNCHVFPDEEISYVGIMKEAKGDKRLGWIKLTKNRGLRIYLYETAMQ